MIELTRLNGEECIINVDHIEMIEKTPDSVITMGNGKKILVKNSSEEIIEKVIHYKRSIFKEVKVVNK